MLISNFVLSHLALSPHVQELARYRLEITNLEPQPITFGLETRLVRVRFADTDTPKSELTRVRQMFAEQVYKLDQGYYIFEEFKLEPEGMYGWTFDTNPRHNDSNGFAEGYFSIRVPAVRETQSPLRFVPQSKTPVRVLVTLIRKDEVWTRSPEDGRVLSSPASISYPQLATGKSYNEIEPDTSPYVHPKFMSKYLRDMESATGTSKSIKSALNVQEQDAAQALLDLLTHVGQDKAELEALNKTLQALDSPLSVHSTRPGAERKEKPE